MDAALVLGSAVSASKAAYTTTRSSVPVVRCEYTEKVRRLSTSSPQNSTRSGSPSAG